MIPLAMAEGIMLYEIIQVIVAFLAVLLAVRWKKTELLAGLSFLFIYTILSLVDVFLFTISRGVYLDIAQFGFILLALIFFIIGMNPAWAHKAAPTSEKGRELEEKPDVPGGIFSYLRKI